MSKSFRHGQILKLIRSKSIWTQEELAHELKKQGIAATQVTLSRDMRELGLAKTPEGYRQVTDNEGGPTLATLAAALARNRTSIREHVMHVAPQPTPSHPAQPTRE